MTTASTKRKAVLAACSDPLSESRRQNIDKLVRLLEARSGGVSQMTTMLEQYLELGAAEQIGGILLGTFTQMDREGLRPGIEEIVMRMFPERIPVARTRFVGHGPDARAIVIGKETRFEDSDR